MSAPDSHPEVTARKTFDELTASPEAFRQLVGMVLLFAQDSDYYEYSGWCRGAVLMDDTVCNCCGNRGSLLAFSKGPEATKPEDMQMVRVDRNELRVMLDHCDVFLGLTPEQSFILS